MKLTGMLLLAAFLLWLPLEDMSIWTTVILAGALSAWLGWRWQHHHPASGWLVSLRGALLGLGTPILAILIMAFKGGLHGHGFPDFTVRQILQTLALLPYTIVIGLLAPSCALIVVRYLKELPTD